MIQLDSEGRYLRLAETAPDELPFVKHALLRAVGGSRLRSPPELTQVTSSATRAYVAVVENEAFHAALWARDPRDWKAATEERERRVVWYELPWELLSRAPRDDGP